MAARTGPAGVVRRIICERLGMDERTAGAVMRAGKSGHRCIGVRDVVVISPPQTSNDPNLSARVVEQVRSAQARLLWSQLDLDRGALQVWAIPTQMVLEMWEATKAPTRDRDGSSADTQMDSDGEDWHWRPAGKDRKHLRFRVSDCHEQWVLTSAEVEMLRNAKGRK